MDEYYCPNCGATLNNQDGFDPDKGTWTCTECDQRLMDDDVYNGDTFKGIEWRCNNCNALLNRQYGFSDALGTWICTACGHTNSITEDEIIDEDELTRCPNCDGALNPQAGFSTYDYDWECTYCGAKLHRDFFSDDFAVVEDEDECEKKDENDCDTHNLFECPNCGDPLDDQWDFDSEEDNWVCTSCGARLHKEYFEDFYEIVDDTYDETEDDEVFEDQDYDEIAASQRQSPQKHMHRNQANQNRIRQEHIPKKRSRKKRFGKIIRRIILTPLLFFLLFSLFNYLYEEYKHLEIGIDSATTIGQNYETISEKLEATGFDNVCTRALEDLPLSDEHLSGTIQSITINRLSEFSINSKFPRDAKITIYYHSIKPISPPMSSETAKEQNYETVKQQFEDAGFVNIKTEVIYDIILGWFTKDGEVESVTIDSDSKFEQHHEYRPDAEVVITYHTYKKR